MATNEVLKKLQKLRDEVDANLAAGDFNRAVALTAAKHDDFVLHLLKQFPKLRVNEQEMRAQVKNRKGTLSTSFALIGPGPNGTQIKVRGYNSKGGKVYAEGMDIAPVVEAFLNPAPVRKPRTRKPAAPPSTPPANPGP